MGLQPVLCKFILVFLELLNDLFIWDTLYHQIHFTNLLLILGLLDFLLQAPVPYPYADPYYGGIFAVCGPHAVVSVSNIFCFANFLWLSIGHTCGCSTIFNQGWTMLWFLSVGICIKGFTFILVHGVVFFFCFNTFS